MVTFEEIAGQYGWVRNLAYKYCKDREEAEDLTGETILKCLSQSWRFDRNRKLRPWIATIMANTFITQYNRKKCVKFERYDIATDIPCLLTSDSEASYNQILNAIRQIERKSLSIRSVLLYIAGYTYKEIAGLLDIPVGTVKSRISFGRKALKTELAKFK